MQGNSVLIKIDVEGYELEVLKGAIRVLSELRPKIIFESSNEKLRGELFRFLNDIGYSIYPLPWRPGISDRALGAAEFLTDAATNFIAI